MMVEGKVNKNKAFEENGKTMINLEWKFLERIAEYYNFPCILFLTEDFPAKEKTRMESLLRRSNTLSKIEEIFEDEREEQRRRRGKNET